MIHLCICIYIYIYILFWFLSLLGYCKILSVVSCAILWVLIGYLFSIQESVYINPSLVIIPLPPRDRYFFKAQFLSVALTISAPPRPPDAPVSSPCRQPLAWNELDLPGTSLLREAGPFGFYFSFNKRVWEAMVCSALALRWGCRRTRRCHLCHASFEGMATNYTVKYVVTMVASAGK